MCHVVLMMLFLFFKQKTAYEMRISDWSSDVCSSDLLAPDQAASLNFAVGRYGVGLTARNSERSSNDPCFHWLQPRGTRGVERGRAQHQSPRLAAGRHHPSGAEPAGRPLYPAAARADRNSVA